MWTLCMTWMRPWQWSRNPSMSALGQVRRNSQESAWNSRRPGCGLNQPLGTIWHPMLSMLHSSTRGACVPMSTSQPLVAIRWQFLTKNSYCSINFFLIFWTICVIRVAVWFWTFLTKNLYRGIIFFGNILDCSSCQSGSVVLNVCVVCFWLAGADRMPSLLMHLHVAVCAMQSLLAQYGRHVWDGGLNRPSVWKATEFTGAAESARGIPGDVAVVGITCRVPSDTRCYPCG